jgi:hypothetical protein
MTESYDSRRVRIRGSEWDEKLHGFIGEGDTDMTEHLAAIGRMVTAFNGIEVMLNQILRSQIGGDEKKARLIVGGNASQRHDGCPKATRLIGRLAEREDGEIARTIPANQHA